MERMERIGFFIYYNPEEQKMECNLLFVVNSVLLGVGLSMDAFSVSLANGLHEPILVVILPRIASFAPFFLLIFAHLECPDMYITPLFIV